MVFKTESSMVKTQYSGSNIEVTYSHYLHSQRPEDPQNYLEITLKSDGTREEITINEKQGAFLVLHGELEPIELDQGLIKKLKEGLPKNITSKFPVLTK